jgi:hypothetical protein
MLSVCPRFWPAFLSHNPVKKEVKLHLFDILILIASGWRSLTYRQTWNLVPSIPDATLVFVEPLRTKGPTFPLHKTNWEAVNHEI